MKIVAGNAQHIGARQEQQDSFGFSDPGNEAFVAHGGFLGVVADGMGGLSHGSEAGRIFRQRSGANCDVTRSPLRGSGVRVAVDPRRVFVHAPARPAGNCHCEAAYAFHSIRHSPVF